MIICLDGLHVRIIRCSKIENYTVGISSSTGHDFIVVDGLVTMADPTENSQYDEELKKLARQIGIEDLSRNELVSNFVANYEFYLSILENSMADGYISVEDKVKLYKKRASIISDDFKLLNDKGELSEENKKILPEILRLIDQMRDDEENLPSQV